MRHGTHNAQPTNVGQIRIIAFALIGGVALFSIVAGVLVTTSEGGPDAAFGNMALPLLIWVGVAMAAAMIMLAFALRSARHRVMKDDESKRTLANYAAATLLFMAPIEGAALFNVIAWLLNGGIVSPIVVGVLVAIMVAFLPSETEFENIGV